MLSEYVGVLLMLALAGSLMLGVLAVQGLLVWRRSSAPEPEPSSESSLEPALDREAPSVFERASEQNELYLLAILLVVFDAAAVFFYSWGATATATGVAGCIAIAVFALPLAVAWLYAWRKGALEW